MDGTQTAATAASDALRGSLMGGAPQPEPGLQPVAVSRATTVAQARSSTIVSLINANFLANRVGFALAGQLSVFVYQQRAALLWYSFCVMLMLLHYRVYVTLIAQNISPRSKFWYLYTSVAFLLDVIGAAGVGVLVNVFVLWLGDTLVTFGMAPMLYGKPVVFILDIALLSYRWNDLLR